MMEELPSVTHLFNEAFNTVKMLVAVSVCQFTDRVRVSGGNAVFNRLATNMPVFLPGEQPAMVRRADHPCESKPAFDLGCWVPAGEALKRCPNRYRRTKSHANLLPLCLPAPLKDRAVRQNCF